MENDRLGLSDNYSNPDHAVISMIDRGKLIHDMGECIKKLNCFYRLPRLVEQSDNSLDQICQGLANLITESWQYPEVTCASVMLDYKEYKTANSRQTKRKSIFLDIENGRVSFTKGDDKEKTLWQR